MMIPEKIARTNYAGIGDEISVLFEAHNTLIDYLHHIADAGKKVEAKEEEVKKTCDNCGWNTIDENGDDYCNYDGLCWQENKRKGWKPRLKNCESCGWSKSFGLGCNYHGECHAHESWKPQGEPKPETCPTCGARVVK